MASAAYRQSFTPHPRPGSLPRRPLNESQAGSPLARFATTCSSSMCELTSTASSSVVGGAENQYRRRGVPGGGTLEVRIATWPPLTSMVDVSVHGGRSGGSPTTRTLRPFIRDVATRFRGCRWGDGEPWNFGVRQLDRLPSHGELPRPALDRLKALDQDAEVNLECGGHPSERLERRIPHASFKTRDVRPVEAGLECHGLLAQTKLFPERTDARTEHALTF